MPSDDFNRAGPGLGANWTTASGFAACQITGSTAATGSTNGDNHSLYTGSSFSVDQYSKVVIGAINNDGGPIVRGSTSAVQAYRLNVSGTGADPNWTLFKITPGPTFTGIATGAFAGNVAAGDTIELRVTGTAPAVLRVFRNDVEDTADTGSLTDSSSPHTTGIPGIGVFEQVLTFTSWEGGDIGATTAQTMPAMIQCTGSGGMIGRVFK